MRRIWKMGFLVVLGVGVGGCQWLFQPPQAVLTATPASGTAPLSVTFSAAGSTGNIVSFTLDFGDGEDFPGTDITAGVNHTYETAGIYTATLTVQDNRGRTSSDSVVITVGPPLPTAVLGAAPTEGTGPLPVVFTVGGQNAAFWELFYGDGNSVAGVAVPQTRSHTFAAVTQTTSYTAVLKVYDSLSRFAADEVEITVYP